VSWLINENLPERYVTKNLLHEGEADETEKRRELSGFDVQAVVGQLRLVQTEASSKTYFKLTIEKLD